MLEKHAAWGKAVASCIDQSRGCWSHLSWSSTSSSKSANNICFPSTPKSGTVSQGEVPTWAPLLPLDFSQFCRGARGQQLSDCSFQYCCEGLPLGIHWLWARPSGISSRLFFFFWTLRLHQGWEVVLWIYESSWILEMRSKHGDARAVADLDRADWASGFYVGVRKSWGYSDSSWQGGIEVTWTVQQPWKFHTVVSFDRSSFVKSPCAGI